MRDSAYTIRLPDGNRITLEKPWQDYTVGELAELGLQPNMSTPEGSPNGTVSVYIPFD